MDMNRYIAEYLQGHPDRHSYIISHEGPSIIDPLLRINVPVLHSEGELLAVMLRKTAEQRDP